MGILPLILGASIGASTPVVHPVPIRTRAPDHPALWVVNDGDTIIYMFGTFHALDGKSKWFDQAVKTAFSQSDELMLETLVPKPQPARAAKTPPSVAAAQPNATMARLAPSASFLATTKVVMSAGRSKGLSTDRGADAVLRDAADDSGKPVKGLESFQFQMNMFSSLPPSPPAAAGASDVQSARLLGAVLSQLESAWNRGEVEQAFTPLLMQMRAQSPETYKTMFIDRNVRWANWIVQRLKTPGTVFVAVGAGHLSGPDSVQSQLASLGVKSARIN
jgi:uncharacterized protein YbaP (TraB family)